MISEFTSSTTEDNSIRSEDSYTLKNKIDELFASQQEEKVLKIMIASYLNVKKNNNKNMDSNTIKEELIKIITGTIDEDLTENDEDKELLIRSKRKEDKGEKLKKLTKILISEIESFVKEKKSGNTGVTPTWYYKDDISNFLIKEFGLTEKQTEYFYKEYEKFEAEK